MNAEAEFDALYAAHAPMVLNLAMRLVGPTDAEDVAQRVWTNVFRSLHAFRREAQPTSWLHRITHNAAIDHHRRTMRQTRGALSLDTLTVPGADDTPVRFVDVLPSTDPEPDALFADAERRALLQGRIGRLTGEHQAVVLAWLEGWPAADACAVLGIPIGTFKSRVHRARTALVAPVHVM